MGRRADHRLATLRNLAASLILHGEVITTEGKGKQLVPFVNRLLHLARGGKTVLLIRRIRSILPHPEAEIRLFDLAKGMEKHSGGYVQIFKVGRRKGDAAPTVLLRLLTSAPKSAPASK